MAGVIETHYSTGQKVNGAADCRLVYAADVDNLHPYGL